MATESKQSLSEGKGKSASAKRGQSRTTKNAPGAVDSTKSKDTTKGDTTSELERRKESGKLSQKALAAQKKAQELRQAANGAADPDERQHLMEEAINTQIEAETFGKTARYLQSGTFQGMVAGTGMGVVPGLTLGTLTGTLVGGTVSMVTGGLGGAMGAATGALHGPFWNMGKLAGKGIRKVTGDLPGWKATDEQKATLEKMMGQVDEQEPPSAADLNSMAEWEKGIQDDGKVQTWAEYGASYVPAMSAEDSSSSKKTGRTSTDQAKKKEVQAKQSQDVESGQVKFRGSAQSSTTSRAEGSNKSPHQASSSGADAPAARSQQAKGNNAEATDSKQKPPTDRPQHSTQESRKRPRKLRQQSDNTKPRQASSSQVRKAPRKLEVRG